MECGSAQPVNCITQVQEADACRSNEYTERSRNAQSELLRCLASTVVIDDDEVS